MLAESVSPAGTRVQELASSGLVIGIEGPAEPGLVGMEDKGVSV